jgi:hypothetical protein
MIAATPAALAAPDLVINGQLTPAVLEPKKIYEVIPYQVASDSKIAEKTASLTEDQKKQIADAGAASSQRALANMAVFPGIMLVFYITLLVYFKSKGGYKAQILATPGSDASAPRPSSPAACRLRWNSASDNRNSVIEAKERSARAFLRSFPTHYRPGNPCAWREISVLLPARRRCALASYPIPPRSFDLLRATRVAN